MNNIQREGKYIVNDPYPLWERAEWLMNLRRYADAKKTLAECFKIAPDYAPAHSLLAQCLYYESKGQKREEAIREAALAVSLAPEWAHGFYILAWLESNFDNHNKALVLIDTAIDLEPENAWFHHQRGYTYYRLNLYAEARKSFGKCLELDPEHYEALRILSYLEREAGNPKLAIAYADRALRLAPENSELFVARGLAASASAAHKQADDLLREAVRLDPENEHAKSMLQLVRKAGRNKYFHILIVVLIMSLAQLGKLTRNFNPPKGKPSLNIPADFSPEKEMEKDIQSSESLRRVMDAVQKKGEEDGLSQEEINKKKFIRYVVEKSVHKKSTTQQQPGT